MKDQEVTPGTGPAASRNGKLPLSPDAATAIEKAVAKFRHKLERESCVDAKRKGVDLVSKIHVDRAEDAMLDPVPRSSGPPLIFSLGSVAVGFGLPALAPHLGMVPSLSLIALGVAAMLFEFRRARHR